MKILIACSQYPPMKTGYAKTAGRLSTWFERLGHEVDVITEGRGCHRIGKVALLDKTGKTMLKARHDIVQVIGPTPLFSEQCVKYAKKEKLPVVYHISAFPGLASYYHNPALGIIDSLYTKLNLYRRLREVDMVVFNTRDFAENCESFYDGLFEIIPEGVDANEPNGHSERYGIGGNRVLFVGQLRRYKGLSYLVMAIKRIRDAGKDIRLDIVGGGPDRDRIQSLVKKVRLQDAVFLHGELSDEERDKMYEQSRVLVLPSVQSESFGSVLLEAATHGTAVIASDLPGVREVVNFLGGELVPPKDIDSLASTLERVLYENVNKGVKVIPSKFLWQNIARTYLSCYGRLTGLEPYTELPTIGRPEDTQKLELVQ